MGLDFTPKSRAEMDEAWQVVAASSAQPTPAPVNNGTVRALTEPEALFYRERQYVYRPVSYLVGQSLVQAMFLLRDAPQSEDGAAYRYHVEKTLLVIDCLKECVRPPGWRGWGWIWKWRANPFADASEWEVADLCAFFVRARTMSSVGRRPGTMEGNPPR